MFMLNPSSINRFATRLWFFIIFAFPVSVSGMQQCANILDADERLACYDSLDNVSENDSDNLQNGEEFLLSGWHLNEIKDPFTDDVSYQAVLFSKTENSEELVLMVSCDKDGLTIGAKVPNFVGNGAKVRYKFGDGKPVTERWLGSSYLIGLPRYYNDFKSGLRTPVGILFEVENYDGTTDIVNFTNAKFGRENLEKAFGDCK